MAFSSAYLTYSEECSLEQYTKIRSDIHFCNINSGEYFMFKYSTMDETNDLITSILKSLIN